MDLDADMLDVSFDISTPLLTESKIKVLNYIDSIFYDVTTALEAHPTHENVQIQIKLKRITSLDTSPQNDHDTQESTTPASRVRLKSREMKYSWPGSTAEEAWRFTCLLCILLEIREAVLSGMTITKRDIYYRQPELFKKQETVDRYIDDIAYTCGVTRRDLRVTASPKGLLCGLPYPAGVQTIPSVDDLFTITAASISSLCWILVIEKEASFKTFVENKFHSCCSLGPGLLVTGKGYPDLSTRQFLRHVLDTVSIPIPIFGLFDGDPDGLDIYRCYRSGSKQLAQEAACNIPEMHWLGVDMAEFLADVGVMDKYLALTGRDRTRARGMLARGGAGGGPVSVEARMRTMLQSMLLLGKKAEIQALDGWQHGGGLCGWVDERMRRSR